MKLFKPFVCLTIIIGHGHLVLINKFKDVYGKDINMERLPATSNVA